MKHIRDLLRGWPVALLGTVALLLVVGAATVRESYRGWKVDQEIRALEAQADELEGRNVRLRELAQTLQSPERLDVEARARLGLRQQGERVVAITGLSATGGWQSAIALDVVADRPHIERSNPELWFDYFFRPDRLDP